MRTRNVNHIDSQLDSCECSRYIRKFNQQEILKSLSRAGCKWKLSMASLLLFDGLVYGVVAVTGCGTQVRGKIEP